MINSLSCDLLIRVKNGSRAGRKSILAPASKFSKNILEKLKASGFISDYSINDDKKSLTINNPQVTDVKILSRPGCRTYCSSSALPWGQTPNSLIIISTSKGLLSQREASVKKLGGELIAEIW